MTPSPETGDNLLAMVALQLDRPPLHRPAGPAMTFEVGYGRCEIAVEATNDGHCLTATASFLAKHTRDAVLRERRPTRSGLPLVSTLGPLIAVGARVDESVVRHAVDRNGHPGTVTG